MHLNKSKHDSSIASIGFTSDIYLSDLVRSPDLYLERCVQYINPQVISPRELSKIDQVRLEYTRMLLEYYLNGRTLFHLTVTYKRPRSDWNYPSSVINKFFTGLYVNRFLPYLLDTHHINKQSCRDVQPITVTFIDEHESFYTHRESQSHSLGERLHHHSILAVHNKNVDRLLSLLGENTFQRFSNKVMTSYLNECEPMRTLYASKMLHRYSDVLLFPDRVVTKNESNYQVSHTASISQVT